LLFEFADIPGSHAKNKLLMNIIRKVKAFRPGEFFVKNMLTDSISFYRK